MPHFPSHRTGTPITFPVDPGFRRPFDPGGPLDPNRPRPTPTPGAIGQFTPGGDSPFPGFPGTGTGDDGGNGGLPGIIEDIFGEEPKFPFFGTLANRNLTPNQKQFFQTQFQPFFNRFLGSSANQLQGGTSLEDIPTFQDFLGDINFRNEFRSLPPSLRPGSSQARFRPPTQFRF